MATTPFDFVKSISETKRDLIDEGEADQSEYVPFVVNRSLSYFLDTVLYANEMNMRHDLDNDMQYKYLLKSIKKGKRFAKWHKSPKTINIDTIKQYYGFSHSKALEASKILTDDQIEAMAQMLSAGGVSKK